MPVESIEQPSDRAVAASRGGHATPDYTAEIRFGVVMYGGVSLAIYINGVTNELFEMACATPRDGVRIVDENIRSPERSIAAFHGWLAARNCGSAMPRQSGIPPSRR